MPEPLEKLREALDNLDGAYGPDVLRLRKAVECVWALRDERLDAYDNNEITESISVEALDRALAGEEDDA